MVAFISEFKLIAFFCCVCEIKFQDTLKKADEIFGPENKDLYTIFEGLISRNVH